LIAEIRRHHGYTVRYKKTWITKQKATFMEFGVWEDSYNELLRWMQAI